MHTLELLRTGKLTGVQRLQLACGLTEFPTEIFDLAETLEILDLSGNKLSSLPDDLPRLHKLRIIFCSDNQFTELPEVLGRCPQLSMIGFKANRIVKVSAQSLPAKLRWLVLTDNQIEELPAELGNCRQLQKLMLAGNRLRELPAELSACTRLELLRISANQLSALPDWLLALPRLSWLAYAGNPYCEERERAALADANITLAAWDELHIHAQLGEGASGVIYRAQYENAHASRTVAVKIFKGEVTSDGLPRSEMAACIAAGEHANLIPIQGKLKDHPQGASGLLMPLIDPEFRNLAGPPSLASCTRDIYAAGTSFDPGTMLNIIQAIASAATHLHRLGIMHGDLYGHNILHCSQGRALLGDFGAASLFAVESPHAHALQRLEVLAFGRLLEELTERCEAGLECHFILERLADLKTACLNEDIECRPLFADIDRMLSELASLYQDKVLALSMQNSRDEELEKTGAII